MLDIIFLQRNMFLLINKKKKSIQYRDCNHLESWPQVYCVLWCLNLTFLQPPNLKRIKKKNRCIQLEETPGSPWSLFNVCSFLLVHLLFPKSLKFCIKENITEHTAWEVPGLHLTQSKVGEHLKTTKSDVNCCRSGLYHHSFSYI